MNLETAIANEIHGVPIGRGSFDVVCDLPHDSPEAVDCDRRVQYECVRVAESNSPLQDLSIVDEWFPDLLRCEDCEIDTLGTPTSGYEEALVELDIGWSHQQRVLDASALTVLDHSPADEGAAPPPVPGNVTDGMYRRRDWGKLRRSRLENQVTMLRDLGHDPLASLIESQM